MNLTKLQLGYITSFIQQKGFDYVDVQLEILDHVASSVEDKMNENPSLGFDEALIKTHQSFGVMGFSTIADGITKSIRAKYNRLFWRNFTAVFGYKYILLLCLSIFGIYKMQELLSTDNFYIFFTMLMLVVFVALIFSNIDVALYKKYAAFKSGTTHLSMFGAVLLLTKFSVDKAPSSFTILSVNVQQCIVSIFIVFFALYFYAAMKTAKASMRETRVLMDKYKLLYA